MRRGIAAPLLVLILAISSCEAAEPQPVSPEWTPISLAAPPGEPGRVMVRDATVCNGRWYLVGAIAGPEDATRPAAWASSDGSAWQALTFQPRPDSFYGKQAILYAAACRDGKLGAVGAKRGGAHGNPRVTTWYAGPEGQMIEADARTELYVSPRAVNVNRIAAGDPGWLMAGNRIDGAAAWLSADGTEFDIVEGVAPLASDAGVDTVAHDAVWHNGTWVIVGGGQRDGRVDRDPLAWTSADGRSWKREGPPGNQDYDEIQRVVSCNGELVGVGLDGSTFRTWRRDANGWRAAARFGDTKGNRPPAVTSVGCDGNTVFAAVASGTRHTLWISNDRGDSWMQMTLPVELTTAADRTMSVIVSANLMVLAVDDAANARSWSARLMG